MSAEPKVLFTLSEREIALLQPDLNLIARSQQAIQGAQANIGRMIRMRAQRDDVALNTETGEVMVASAPAAPAGDDGAADQGEGAEA